MKFLRRGLSHLVGALADLPLPRPLRGPVHRAFAAYAGADLDEVELPLAEYPSLGAFFVRRLKPGARVLPADPRALASPVDGRVQALHVASAGLTLQAKGRSYRLGDLLGPLGAGADLEGADCLTIYLSPRDYHRIHAPFAARLERAHWIDGERHSVAPRVLERRAVLDVNERCVLEFSLAGRRAWMVLVGALNVGRMKVVDVAQDHAAPTMVGREIARGEELARFEMGSTIVLVLPRGMARCSNGLRQGDVVRLHQSLGTLS
jgi:phosphatidylserine decarboxylase